MPLIDVPTVHAVTDPTILADPDFPRLALAIWDALGPRAAIHLRGHDVPAALLSQVAGQLASAQEATGALLVINNRVDVAVTSGARAVQLGQRSLTPADARLVGPDLVIGVSVHSAAEADAAPDASWWLAGHVFPTASHPGEPGRGPAFLTALAGRGVPVIAIGGITPATAHAARAAGAHGVAAIRGIWYAPDPVRAAISYL